MIAQLPENAKGEEDGTKGLPWLFSWGQRGVALGFRASRTAGTVQGVEAHPKVPCTVGFDLGKKRLMLWRCLNLLLVKAHSLALSLSLSLSLSVSTVPSGHA